MGLVAIQTVFFLGLIAAIGLFILMGRSVALPTWIVSRVEVALNDNFDNINISLDGVFVVVEDKLRPRVTLRDVTLSNSETNSTISLEEMDATFSLSDLGSGLVVPTDLRVAGLSLALRRSEDGAFDLAFGDQGLGMGGIDAQSALAGVGQEIENLLSQPFFAQLDRVSIEAMSLRYEDLRSGRAWNVDGAEARMERDGPLITFGAHLALLGGRGYASAVDLALETSYDTQEARAILTFDSFPAEEIASQSAALAWLGAIRAPISGSLRAFVDPQGRLGPTTVSLAMEEGFLRPEGAENPIPIQSALTHLTYRPDQNIVTLDRLAISSDWVTFNAQGQAVLGDFKQGLPQETVFQLGLHDVQVTPTEESAVTLALDDAYVDFRLRLDPFEVTLGQLILNQPERQLALKGGLSVENGDWVYHLAGSLNSYNRADLMAIWPDGVKPRLHKWFRENLFAGDFRDLVFRLKSRPDDKPEVFLNFLVDNAEVRFMKTMPHVRDVAGFATLIHDKFYVTAEQGWVEADQGGLVDGAGTTFVVENTKLRPSPGTVHLKANGPVTAFFSLLEREPLQVMTKANLPVDLAQGDLRAEGTLRMILKPKIAPEDLTFEIFAEGEGMRTDHFIKGKEMVGDVKVRTTHEHVVVDAVGALGALPATARWETAIGKKADGKSTLTGQSEISPVAIEEFEIGFPDGTVRDKAKADIRIDMVKGQPPAMVITSDLVGARLSVPQLGWAKPASVSGQAKVNLTLTSPPTIDAFEITAPGIEAEGYVELTPEGGMKLTDFTAFRVGEWLRGAAQLVGRGQGNAPAVVMRSGVFDMRYLPAGLDSEGAGEANAASGPITAQLDEARVSETIALSNVTANLTTNDGMRGTFTGNLNGAAPVRGEIYPENGGTGVHVVADNAARVLMAMNLLDAATGGTLSLRLAPNPDRDVWDGSFQVLNIKVQELPVIAELLNAVSVVGLLDQMSGPGILFNEIVGRFQLSDTRLVLGQSSAVGPAMGISADGYYRLADSFLDMQGAISPLFVVNQMGRVISKKGEGLIAFNYQVKGPIDAYSIAVNPLSALTPGFFREIFRRPPPSMEDNTLSVPQQQPQTEPSGAPGQPQDNR